jgi:signal peptidase I
MRKAKKSKEQSTFREYFELIVETVIFVFFVITFVVQAFQIPTGSMEKTLLIGDFLLVNKFAYSHSPFPLEKKILPTKEIKKNDMVVFKYPKDITKDFVKRVIALEGDKVEIKEKQVWINDNPIIEDFKIHNDIQIYTKNDYYRYDDYIRDNFGPVVVPSGHCFVMGDNRDDSYDSRYWGFLPLNYIKGRPWVIYFSYEAEKNAYLKTSVRDRLAKLVRFIPEARWKRILHVIH